MLFSSGHKMVCIFFTEPPGPPRKLAVDDVTESSCRLSWKQPEFDGGADVTGYFVEKRQEFSDRWLKVTKTI